MRDHALLAECRGRSGAGARRTLVDEIPSDHRAASGVCGAPTKTTTRPLCGFLPESRTLPIFRALPSLPRTVPVHRVAQTLPWAIDEFHVVQQLLVLLGDLVVQTSALRLAEHRYYRNPCSSGRRLMTSSLHDSSPLRRPNRVVAELQIGLLVAPRRRSGNACCTLGSACRPSCCRPGRRVLLVHAPVPTRPCWNAEEPPPALGPCVRAGACFESQHLLRCISADRQTASQITATRQFRDISPTTGAFGYKTRITTLPPILRSCEPLNPTSAFRGRYPY